MKRVYYHLMYVLARLIFPYAEIQSAAPLPDEPAVFICNHSQIRGPVMMTLYFNRPHKNWVVSFAMDPKKAANFAYHDFLLGESRKHKRFYRLLSHPVGAMVIPLMNPGSSIPVWHDKRINETFSRSVEALKNGFDIVIFGESPKHYSPYVNELQPGFVTIGRFFYRETGKLLNFYPVYVEKRNRLISIGQPVAYNPDISLGKQMNSVSHELTAEIDTLARNMKKHKPVPFLADRWYRAYGQYTEDFTGYWKMIDEGS